MEGYIPYAFQLTRTQTNSNPKSTRTQIRRRLLSSNQPSVTGWWILLALLALWSTATHCLIISSWTLKGER